MKTHSKTLEQPSNTAVTKFFDMIRAAADGLPTPVDAKFTKQPVRTRVVPKGRLWLHYTESTESTES